MPDWFDAYIFTTARTLSHPDLLVGVSATPPSTSTQDDTEKLVVALNFGDSDRILRPPNFAKSIFAKAAAWPGAGGFYPLDDPMADIHIPSEQMVYGWWKHDCGHTTTPSKTR